MKKLYSLFALALLAGQLSAQIQNPVSWNYTAKKISGNTYEVYLTATLEPNWHIYAQKAGEGPEPTTVRFDKNPLLKMEGAVREAGKLQESYDPNFKSTLRYYSKQVSFVQKLTLKSAANTFVKGSVTYMVCNDNRCLPPKEVPFSIKIEGK